MKNIKLLLFIFCAGLLMTSCTDLNLTPKNKPVIDNALKSYTDFQTYNWSLYKTAFTDANIDPHTGLGDLVVAVYEATGPDMVNGRVTTATTNGLWNFSSIRQVNVMLDKVDGSDMTDAQKNDIRSVGYFFRAYQYFLLLKQFGDLPWLEHAVSYEDKDVLYAPRDSREVVANNMLSNLIFAEANINPKGNGSNTINPNVVRAFISRFGLYEGTWRKYHGAVDGVDGTKYLQASVDASQQLIDANLGLVPNYDQIMNSLSLDKVPGILLYKEYEYGLAGAMHSFTYTDRDVANYDGTKKLVSSYLCSDGRPIGSSAVYAGDNTMYDEFRNRDHRLFYTIIPPYDNTTTAGKEYYALVNDTLSGGNPYYKQLPVILGRGNYTIPTASMPSIIAIGGENTQLGYKLWATYNNGQHSATYGNNETDVPIFRMGEVLINHAEAEFELGNFTQAVADATINKLRARAGGVAPMIVDAIDASFDPARDADVDPVLWEIRRERAVELISTPIRYDDLMRWKKGDYLSAQPEGLRIPDLSVYSAKDQAKLQAVLDANSCITFVQKPTTAWMDKYYLYPVPQTQITLNPNLTQNPGW